MIVYLISALLYFGDFYPTVAILPDRVGIYYYNRSRSKRRKSKNSNATFIPQKSKAKRNRHTTRDKIGG